MKYKYNTIQNTKERYKLGLEKSSNCCRYKYNIYDTKYSGYKMGLGEIQQFSG